MASFRTGNSGRALSDLRRMMERLNRIISGPASPSHHSRYMHNPSTSAHNSFSEELGSALLKNTFSGLIRGMSSDGGEESSFRASEGQTMATLASSISRAMKRNL